MNLLRRQLLGTVGATTVLPLAGARAQFGSTPPLRIGVLRDQSGPYSGGTGATSIACVRQAIEEFGATSRGVAVEVNSSAATADLTGRVCSPNGIHWTYDTWMLANCTGNAVVRTGGDSWFFIVANFAFGHALERDTANAVRKAGGRVLSRAAHPAPGTTDYSSYLLQAQASRAKVIGLAHAGEDAVNTIKQAAEFDIVRSGQRLAALLLYINDVHAIGLPTARGLMLTESFYWDLNERTRSFTQRVLPKTGGQRPNMSQAGCYSVTLHYLKAAADMGVAEAKRNGAATVARMQAMPTDDDVFGPLRIRQDGRKLHPVYLFRVKTPEASRGPWDYYELMATTGTEEAFRPLAEGGCHLIAGRSRSGNEAIGWALPTREAGSAKHVVS
ncbi:ABC transporter substrate-binding protein [Roseicella sp. DB1501]|uniref:ABC transporter substrate-binding protein n=1 Tax=Roseicella sp. DB1501 TaxID=2730925 RepID=UPI0014913B75|nr:ABC transporter substrate-binding protein [Roseicella sp. DB1501]NOG74005.1 ABC transporter substrate-binding protein [Roseicella sp. DB1501]